MKNLSSSLKKKGTLQQVPGEPQETGIFQLQNQNIIHRIDNCEARLDTEPPKVA